MDEGCLFESYFTFDVVITDTIEPLHVGTVGVPRLGVPAGVRFGVNECHIERSDPEMSPKMIRNESLLMFIVFGINISLPSLRMNILFKIICTHHEL